MVTKAKKEELYNRALLTWGFDAQLDQLVEECAELIVAVNHLKRERISTDEFAGELADVTIMVEQMKYGFDLDAIVEDIISHKIERTSARLDKYTI